MKKSIMRAALAAAALTLALPAGALAIQGGGSAAGQFPNVAILRFVDSNDPATRWRCTGTLVAPTVIITAAHCTEPPVDTAYYSFADQGPTGEPEAPGSGWKRAGTDADGTESVLTHPAWDGDLQLNELDDVGLVLLDRPVTGITPAMIAPQGHLNRVRTGTIFTVAGYGVSFDKPASGPQKPVADNLRVKRYTTAPLSNITRDTIMLATNPKDGRAGGGTCFGDSGGPIFDGAGLLVGVTSWGTSQFCKAGQAGFQRLDTADARSFFIPYVYAG